MARKGAQKAALFRVATFNINDINGRLANLLAWLAHRRPDAVCLQELKCSQAAFPAEAVKAAGYGAAWVGEGRWNGVAILARGAEPVVTRRRLPGDPADRQARYIEAAVGGVLIGNLYAPNGNPQPGSKFTYKLAWLQRLAEHAAALQEAGVPAVLAGDYNIVPTDDDIYPSKSWAKNALVQPGARAIFAGLLEAGWTDSLAERSSGAAPYTFWDYMRERWARDAGMRIDHLMLSASLAPHLADAGVDRAVRGEFGASDHAPAWITLHPVPSRTEQ